MRVPLLFMIAALSGCSSDAPTVPTDPCSVPTGQADITIDEPADPPMQLRIESCRVDSDACKDLCTAAMSLHNVGGTTTSCSVEFDSSHAYVSAKYNNSCVFASGAGDGGPIK